MLTKTSDLQAWAAWIREMFHFTMAMIPFDTDSPKWMREFAIQWITLTSLLERDLTFRSAPAFGKVTVVVHCLTCYPSPGFYHLARYQDPFTYYAPGWMSIAAITWMNR